MSKVKHPNDLQMLFEKMYKSGKLYSNLRTNFVLDIPISRVWAGRIEKTSLSYYKEVIEPWQKEWDNAKEILGKYNILIKRYINDKDQFQYRIYNRIYTKDVRNIFAFLRKTKELEIFNDHCKELSLLDCRFIEPFYNRKTFREWVYHLSDNLTDFSFKEINRSITQWNVAILKGIVDRCNTIPQEMEYSRNVYLPYLHSKFLERNVGMIRFVYNTIHNDSLKNSDELAVKLNVSFGDPTFEVVYRKQNLHLDIDQLNELFSVSAPTVLLISENEKPMRAYNFSGITVIGGVGWAISKLFEKCKWLQKVNRIYYWGDCDMAGFAMLNMVREYRNDICSVLMTDLDKIKIDRHTQDANSLIHPHTLHQLNTEELKACEWIYKEKIRIEQERINSSYVEKMIEDLYF